VQQRRAPRPLPLFIELVRIAARKQPEMAAKALDGLAAYESARRPPARVARPILSSCGSISLRDHGGSGRALVLVPSLINPPNILDLDDEVSLADALAQMGRRVLLVDWGNAAERSSLDVGGHVEALAQILAEQGRPAVLGYCLGGTMAIAAANLTPVERVITLAAPWRFARYPPEARTSLERLWESARGAAADLGALPMEVLQSAFWSLDPQRTVGKFAHFAELPPGGDEARRFVTLEDWANEGEPLPYPAARQLIEDIFGRDLPGCGEWSVGGKTMTDRLDCPVLNVTASADRIAPAATAPTGDTVSIDAGHVGMIVGSARAKLHALVADFLDC
jgi:polyhydroxyalkanoate synthase